MLIDNKMKKSVEELGHNGRLKNAYPKKIMAIRLFKSISPKWLSIFG